MANKLTVNIVSESDVTVQGHGVHTAYDEMASALEKRDDITVIRGEFGKQIDCDIVHMHTIGNRTWRKLFQRGPKKVVTAHIVPASLIGSIILAKYWAPFARIYMRWYYNRADKVLAVSGMVARTLHDELHVPEDKIATFYNTVNMASYAPHDSSRKEAREKLDIAKDAFIVLGNGQVQPRKRLDVFVEMAKALPDVTFIWIGGIPFKQLGADSAEMNHLITNTPANMKITGVIPHDDVYSYLHAADVFCLPAEQENHPMCVLEAAGARLPIVLRDLPEYDDTFKDDTVRCQDNEEFIRMIQRLKDDHLFYNSQKKSSEKIAERFDNTAAAGKYVELYRSLLV
ncbi:MAG: glycosyltransferase family 4 protein [Candidatus Saccharimonadales bacterium]